MILKSLSFHRPCQHIVRICCWTGENALSDLQQKSVCTQSRSPNNKVNVFTLLFLPTNKNVFTWSNFFPYKNNVFTWLNSPTNKNVFTWSIAQLAGAVEYTDNFSAEG